MERRTLKYIICSYIQKQMMEIQRCSILRMQQQLFHHLHMSRKLKGSKEQQKYGKEKNEGT